MVNTLLESLEHTNYDIICLNETRTPQLTSQMSKDGHLIIRGPRDPSTNSGGVGFIFNPRFANNILDATILNPRIGKATVYIDKKRTLSVYSCYCPTQDNEEEREQFYDALSEALQTDSGTYRILTGDFNGTIGPRRQGERIVGIHSNDVRDAGGERLIEFASSENLFVCNGFFQKPLNRRWTHSSPGHLHHREIDYSLCSHPRIITDVGVLSRIDYPSDHRPLRTRVLFERNKMTWKKKDSGRRKTYDYKQCGILMRMVPPRLEPLPDLQEDYDQMTNTIFGHLQSSSSAVPNHKESRISSRTRELLRELRQRKIDNVPYSSLAKEVRRRLEEDHEKFRNAALLRAATQRRSIKTTARLTKQYVDYPSSLKKPDGTLTRSTTEKRAVVQDFYSQLFASTQATLPAAFPLQDDPLPFLSEEVEASLRKTANRKACGEDGIPVEILKEAGTRTYQAIANRFSEYLRKCWIPKQWRTSNTTLIHKKGASEDLNNYRPISVLPILYRVFMKCILTRIRRTLESQQPVEQAGFRRGFSTMDHIHSICRLIEVGREYQIPVVMVFVDFEKAFDSLEITSIIDALRMQNVAPEYVNIISQCYHGLTTKIKMMDEPIEIPVTKGVRQGDPISPTLFSATLEHAMRILDWEDRGIKINGTKLNHLRFADDLVLIAHSSQEAEVLLEELSNCTKPHGLRINKKKTVVMRNKHADAQPLHLSTCRIPEVDSFTYLGREINTMKELEPELLRRQRAGWAAFHRIEPIMRNSTDVQLKANLFNSTVLPALTYAGETWAFTEKTERRLRTTQANIERRMLGLTLREQREQNLHNTDIRQKTQVKDAVQHVNHSKHRWAGHVMRKNDDRWTKKLTEWRPYDHKRPRGRPPMRWADSLSYRCAQRTGNFNPPWQQLTKDRDVWKSMWDSQLSNRP